MMGNKMRLIDATALIEDITAAEENAGMGALVAGTLRRYVLRQTTIDPEILRPKGRWKLLGETDYKCSVCGFRFTSGDPIEMFPYCRCGAKMEG
jgi:hypothetical protein